MGSTQVNKACVGLRSFPYVSVPGAEPASLIPEGWSVPASAGVADLMACVQERRLHERLTPYRVSGEHRTIRQPS
jgi:hypothetical protein